MDTNPLPADVIAADDTAAPDAQSIISNAVYELWADLYEMNNIIYTRPETSYKEFIAHNILTHAVETLGCTVQRHAFGLPTAFLASYGSGGRSVAFIADYDAVPGIGHAYANNLVTTAAVAGFLALVEVLKATNTTGRAILIGTPAQAAGTGKVRVFDEGGFANADFCLLARPGLRSSLCRADFCLTGMTTSAQRAVTINFTPPPPPSIVPKTRDIFARSRDLFHNLLGPRGFFFNYKVHDAPQNPTDGPDTVSITYTMRAPNLLSLHDFRNRVVHLMGGSTINNKEIRSIQETSSYQEMRPNRAMCRSLIRSMAKYGHVVHMDDPDVTRGISDLGVVSTWVPTTQLLFCIPAPPGAKLGTPSWTEAAGSMEAFFATLDIAKGLALTAVSLLVEDTVAARVKDEHIDILRPY